jgi:phosphatidylglycerophosphate synthase
MKLLDLCRDVVRAQMRVVARVINKLSGGRISPNFVTIFGFLMHLPIALLIARGYFGYGAVMLVIFGLFDTLDGELARKQKRASAAGMLLDASTDRMKEVLLYTGAAYALAGSGQTHATAWAVAACGASICVSYIKAKGETAVKDSGLSPNEINRLFQDGLGRFEVRMFLLVVGLLLNQLLAVLIIITVLSTMTAFERLIKISRKLS